MLRRLEDRNKEMGLKLIWLLFASGGSSWVSWVRRHLIGTQNFWLLEGTNGSWIWKNLCKLRSLVRPFIFCEVASGITASFWFDNWTDLGSLIELTGPQGTAVTGLQSDAVGPNGWWISSSRSRNPLIVLLKACLPDYDPILNSEEDDRYLWKSGIGDPKPKFSAAETWRVLNPEGARVSWHEQVWFKGRIPKHAFLTWVVVRDRLVTRDRLISWGLQVPSVCLL